MLGLQPFLVFVFPGHHEVSSFTPSHTLGPQRWNQPPWIKALESVSLRKPLLFSSCSSQVLWYSNRRWWTCWPCLKHVNIAVVWICPSSFMCSELNLWNSLWMAFGCGSLWEVIRIGWHHRSGAFTIQLVVLEEKEEKPRLAACSVVPCNTFCCVLM